jgi:hypothetical protein
MNVNGTYLLWGNRFLGGLVQFLNGLRVVPEILLASNEDDRKALAEMENFRDPLAYHHVSEQRICYQE